MAHDESVTDNQHPLENLTYDWVNVVKNKAEALLAYKKYIHDAEAANSQECAQMFRRLHDEDARHLDEAKRHLAEVLGGRMGSQSQSGGQRSGGMGSNTGAQS
jgi:hypothetical protein